ncbi:MAG: ABC transporter ATP-binding protein, partial [Oscillospiraceae bacterium]|nr:ABC transporter ATP-binding protein [Oscillospiraceae bacterium]
MSVLQEWYPLILVGGIIGLFALLFTGAYLMIRRQKEAIGFDRNMKDGEIVRRLLHYARPHVRSLLLVLLVMLFSIAYDILSPLLIGQIEEMIKNDFPMRRLLIAVAVYAGILLVSLACTYIQAILLQIVGQKILSRLREDLFTHIESLSHAQLNEIPVGKLVTRVTNDTNAISMMFTNILVNL